MRTKRLVAGDVLDALVAAGLPAGEVEMDKGRVTVHWKAGATDENKRKAVAIIAALPAERTIAPDPLHARVMELERKLAAMAKLTPAERAALGV